MRKTREQKFPSGPQRLIARIRAVPANGSAPGLACLHEDRVVRVGGSADVALDVAGRLEAAVARGIIVTNTPEVLNDAVADLALALILGIERRFRGWLRPGDSALLYGVLYSAGRFYTEGLRTDSLCVGTYTLDGSCAGGLRIGQEAVVAVSSKEAVLQSRLDVVPRPMGPRNVANTISSSSGHSIAFSALRSAIISSRSWNERPPTST